MFVLDKILRDKTTDGYDYAISENDSLVFDHPVVIAGVYQDLKIN